MTLEEECTLSYYKKITTIGQKENVFLVKHTQTDKIYVRKDLKIYNRSIYEFMKRHPSPNMPHIYECIEDQGVLIIIEEYIHGDSLECLLQERGVFSEDKVCSYMRELSETLNYLHSCQPPIIHRDIKPSNVILTNDGTLKLIDINIAKPYKTGAQHDTVLMGTREFAAPEQYGFGQSDARTDIFAIGVMMNYLLCGKFPNDMLYQGKLTSVIQQCIELDPNRRYQNMKQFERALDQVQPQFVFHKENGKIGGKEQYLLPGFRSKNPLKIGAGILGYLLVAYISVTLEIKDNGIAVTGSRLIFERCWCWILMMGLILFDFDYLEIQKKLPLTKSCNRWIRLSGVVFYNIGFVFFWIFLMVILETIFKI